MQISLKWVNEIVNISRINLDYFIEKLTLGGFEVEEIIENEENGQKTISLDISSTANRSDSLSINGISREIGTLFDKPYKLSNYLLQKSAWQDQFSQMFLPSFEKRDDSIFLAIIVKNLNKIQPPEWLTKKLIYSGISPENSLVDYKNFVLLETGYPFEFYNLTEIESKLNSNKFHLTLTNKIENHNFTGMNNNDYQLTDSTLLVKANKIPISIAGLMPQKEFEYVPETNSILIEGSIFNSSFIRKQSRSLGLRTDRSARYEKSIKNTDLFSALYRLLRLLKVSNPDLLCQFHTFSQVVLDEPKTLSLSYNLINETLGPIKGSDSESSNYINPILISRYLTRLQFPYQYNAKKLTWMVQIPEFRIDDILRPIDLIEEIGRLHGFNQFVTRLPIIRTVGLEDHSYKTRKKITNYLVNIGFNELIHYSLVGDQKTMTTSIKIVNPLLTDSANLRITVLPNLIKAIKDNLNQGNLYFDGFEYGHTFFQDKFNNFYEKEVIGGIFGGSKLKNNWSESGELLSWFRAKGKINLLFEQLNIVTNWKTASDSNYSNLLHPYRSAQIYLKNGKCIGVFGQIHPIMAIQMNLIPELYLFEFDFDLVKDQLKKNKITLYKEYSVYPKIVKDISFVIDQKLSFTEIRKILLKNGTKFLTDVRLLDEYKSNSLPKNHISLCVQLVFSSSESTLQNKLIDKIINNIQILLKDYFNAQIRA